MFLKQKRDGNVKGRHVAGSNDAALDACFGGSSSGLVDFGAADAVAVIISTDIGLSSSKCALHMFFQCHVFNSTSLQHLV